jgi:hypothetical protein
VIFVWYHKDMLIVHFIGFKNGLNQNFPNSNALFKDIEVIFNTVTVIIKEWEIEGFWSDFNLSSLLEFTIHCKLDSALNKSHIKDLILEFFVPYMKNFGSQIFPEEGPWWVCFNSMLSLKLYFSY